MRAVKGNFSFTSFLLIWGIILYWLSLPVSSAIPPQERAALVALYNSTNGNNWTSNSGWKTPPLAADGFALPGTENTWYGITCDPFNSTVQKISMHDNNLDGTIPPELENLANLQYLALYRNLLSGGIPPELGKLANLQYLVLFSNQLSGIIPPELGKLANLQELWLSFNQLSGSIPPELGNLANLQELYLSNTQLSGSIPPELGNLANLRYLGLNSNQLSGSIPPELGNLANLQYLGLYRNVLSGGIPPELGNLANLQNLVLFRNQLSGSIPPELGNLVNLRYLALSSNRLSGDIPSSLMNLTKLMNNFSDIRWNALYTNDDALRAFLNSKQYGGNWESTQTTAPLDVNAVSATSSSIDINWTHIIYTSNTGGYRVYYSTSPGGPYTYFGMTADKTASFLSVTGLNPGTTYYFVVQTRTWPHLNNQNIVDSEYSAVVSAETLPDIVIISGTITSAGSGLAGVTLTLSNGGGTAVTDANGNYSVTVNYDWTGTATPSQTGYNFSPLSRSYTNITADQTNQDYTALLQVVAISGTVTHAGSGLPGVTLTLSNGGGTAVTDVNGNYSVTVNYGWTGTATPSQTGCNFSPLSRNYTNVTTDQTNQDYTAVLQGFHVSGTVTYGGSGLAGVTITLSNKGGTMVTGPNGKYRITVDYGWTGTATPSKIGYIFSPVSRTYNNVTTNQSGQDYTAALQTFTLSGTVTYAGSGLPGVDITLSNKGGAVVTDVNGYYSVTVNYGWTGVITPSKGYYLFNPANRDYPLVTSNINNQDYTASIPLSLAISASRQNDRSFLTSNDLGIITLTVENSQSIPDIRFVIYRKTSTSGYQPIKELTSTELQGGIYIYYDKYIDKDITFTYRVTAYDLAGNIIVVSNEENI